MERWKTFFQSFLRNFYIHFNGIILDDIILEPIIAKKMQNSEWLKLGSHHLSVERKIEDHPGHCDQEWEKAEFLKNLEMF